MIFNPPGSPLPAEFDGALFFADYARGCIWAMERGTNGAPESLRGQVVPRRGVGARWTSSSAPAGTSSTWTSWDDRIQRIHYAAGNQAPKAVAVASPTSGDVPLPVKLDGRGSSDPDGGALTYAWDTDGDGAYDDSNTAIQQWTYGTAGTYPVGLKVTDPSGASATDTVAVTVGNTPPTASHRLALSGAAVEGGGPGRASAAAPPIARTATSRRPSSAGHWRSSTARPTATPTSCSPSPDTDHASFAAPDHEYPSYLELTLTATDSGGLTDTRTIRLDPKTVDLTLRSSPTGLKLAVNAQQKTTPFVCTVIEGSANTLSAVTPQTLAGKTYDFGSWSDGGVGTHNVTATAAGTYTATYTQR